MDPGRTHIYFQITDDLGCNKTHALNDTEVVVENTIKSGSGGHHHFVGENKPGTGSYVPMNLNQTVSDSAPYRIEGTANFRGAFETAYVAGLFGVTEVLNITLVRPPRKHEPEEIVVEAKSGEDQQKDELDIRVPGLVHMDPNTNGFVYRYKGGCPHLLEDGTPAAQFGTTSLYARVRALDSYYHSLTGNHLSYNDASLP